MTLPSLEKDLAPSTIFTKRDTASITLCDLTVSRKEGKKEKPVCKCSAVKVSIRSQHRLSRDV